MFQSVELIRPQILSFAARSLAGSFGGRDDGSGGLRAFKSSLGRSQAKAAAARNSVAAAAAAAAGSERSISLADGHTNEHRPGPDTIAQTSTQASGRFRASKHYSRRRHRHRLSLPCADKPTACLYVYLCRSPPKQTNQKSCVRASVRASNYWPNSSGNSES